MDSGAIGNAFVLKVKHFLPNAIAILSLAFIQRFLFEDTSLHLIKKFNFGKWAGIAAIVVVILLPILEGRMALAGQEVDALLEVLVVQVVVPSLIDEVDEAFSELIPRLLDVDQRLVYQDDLVLRDLLLGVVPHLLLAPHLLHLLRKVLALRRPCLL